MSETQKKNPVAIIAIVLLVLLGVGGIIAGVVIAVQKRNAVAPLVPPLVPPPVPPPVPPVTGGGAVPPAEVPLAFTKPMCVGAAYVPLRYKLAEGENCAGGDFRHLVTLEVANNDMSGADLDTYCVGKATNPERYNVLKASSCSVGDFTHQTSFKVPSRAYPGVNRQWCVGNASGPDRYIVAPGNECGQSGFTQQHSFYTRLNTDPRA